nr:immunoglobulin heavy chain junction region [Macaca mulatta]MOV36601.1 immunoglobulin heavy chain junction region [Macaca mulatta]
CARVGGGDPSDDFDYW